MDYWAILTYREIRVQFLRDKHQIGEVAGNIGEMPLFDRIIEDFSIAVLAVQR
jgi:hypothetical protein